MKKLYCKKCAGSQFVLKGEQGPIKTYFCCDCATEVKVINRPQPQEVWVDDDWREE